MEKFILILMVYLAGCILAYGRIYASAYEIDREFIRWMKPTGLSLDTPTVLLVILSWFTFLAGSISYIADKDKYFLKYNNDDLIEKYNNRKDLWKTN